VAVSVWHRAISKRPGVPAALILLLVGACATYSNKVLQAAALLIQMFAFPRRHQISIVVMSSPQTSGSSAPIRTVLMQITTASLGVNQRKSADSNSSDFAIRVASAACTNCAHIAWCGLILDLDGL
jgi:hypothetical protein